MRYVMKEKLFAFGDDFTIQNEHGQDVFFVDGKAFSIGDQLSFQDMKGNELAFINGVDVADDEDAILILASAVVVDQACHPDRKR